MNSRAQNAPGVTGEGHGRAREPGWYPFATPEEIQEHERLAEHARAAYWLAAWRGISHDHVAGIVGGTLLGSGVDVLERIHRHTRAALDRAGR